jgi:S1/P1 Nuclease
MTARSDVRSLPRSQHGHASQGRSPTSARSNKTLGAGVGRHYAAGSRQLLLLPSHAPAWGSEGHHIIADIAEQYLEPATAQQVHELLALENATTLVAVSMWADDIRAQRPETAPAAARISDERAYALNLAHSISPAEAEKWRGGTPADWADDSYGVASNLIYGVWPHSPGVLPASYEQKAIYVVQVQLEKGGVRLAAMF